MNLKTKWAVVAVAACLSAGAASAADQAVVTAKEVLVVNPGGHRQWVPVPASAETDDLGRIKTIMVDGKPLDVLATAHRLDGRKVVVERIAYEGDATPATPAPTRVNFKRKG